MIYKKKDGSCLGMSDGDGIEHQGQHLLVEIRIVLFGLLAQRTVCHHLADKLESDAVLLQGLSLGGCLLLLGDFCSVSLKRKLDRSQQGRFSKGAMLRTNSLEPSIQNWQLLLCKNRRF